jgi:hypothetical protein
LQVGLLVWISSLSLSIVADALANFRKKYGNTAIYLIVTMVFFWAFVWIPLWIIRSLYQQNLSYIIQPHLEISGFFAWHVIILLGITTVLLWWTAPLVQAWVQKRRLPTLIVLIAVLYVGFEVLVYVAKTADDPLTQLAPIAQVLNGLEEQILLDKLGSWPKFLVWGSYAALITSLIFLTVIALQIIWVQERRTLLTNLVQSWRWAMALTVSAVILLSASYGVGNLTSPVQKLHEYQLPALPNKYIERIVFMYEDHLGDLWAGTDSGIYRYEGDQWVARGTGLPDQARVNTLLSDTENQLWAGMSPVSLPGEQATSAVYRYEGDQWVAHGTGLPDHARVSTLVIDG